MNHDENSQSYVGKSFNDALNLVVENGQVSVSILQRKMKIGYGRAEMYIKEMEKNGYISAYDGTNPRKILISKEELQKLNKLNKIESKIESEDAKNDITTEEYNNLQIEKCYMCLEKVKKKDKNKYIQLVEKLKGMYDSGISKDNGDGTINEDYRKLELEISNLCNVSVGILFNEFMSISIFKSAVFENSKSTKKSKVTANIIEDKNIVIKRVCLSIWLIVQFSLSFGDWFVIGIIAMMCTAGCINQSKKQTLTERLIFQGLNIMPVSIVNLLHMTNNSGIAFVGGFIITAIGIMITNANYEKAISGYYESQEYEDHRERMRAMTDEFYAHSKYGYNSKEHLEAKNNTQNVKILQELRKMNKNQ